MSVYCYALCPNHFHLLAKINDEATIIEHFEEIKTVVFLPVQHNLSDFVMERFGNFLNRYSKAFNRRYTRKGALFMDFMRRGNVKVQGGLTSYIWYIYKNAVHHQISKNVVHWQFDSYASILSECNTSLLRA